MSHRSRSGYSQWLSHEPSPHSSALLFVLPYFGFGAGMYHNWPTRIGDVEVCHVRLPGRADGSATMPFGSYGEIAEAMLDALTTYFDRPSAFFGHETFALLGYEVVARRAPGTTSPPVDLFVSAQESPRGPAAERFLGMTEQQLAEEVCTIILEMGGNPIPSLVERYLRVLRFDVEVATGYHPIPPPDCDLRVTTIGWERDQLVRPESMAGWSEFGSLSSHVLPGDHHSFLSAPEELIGLMRTSLVASGS